MVTDTRSFPEHFKVVREALDYLRDYNTETGSKHPSLASLDAIAEGQHDCGYLCDDVQRYRERCAALRKKCK